MDVNHACIRVTSNSYFYKNAVDCKILLSKYLYNKMSAAIRTG